MKNDKENAKAVLRIPASEGKDYLIPSKIARILSGTEGIYDVAVNYVTNTVSLEYDQEKINLEEIRIKIVKIDSESAPSNDFEK